MPLRRLAVTAVLLLGAVVAAAVVASGGRASKPRATSPPAESWRGLVGSGRVQVALGQRMIVVMRAASLADRIRRAGGAASDDQERHWTAEALSAQQDVLLQLDTKGIFIKSELRFTRVLNGFSAALDPSAVPANAEFTVLSNDNPYGCTSTSAISVYRRPLPTTNLPFLTTVMWDGRETFKNPDGTFKPITDDLAHQAVDATTGHAQGAVPSPEQVQQIVDFETQIFTAQTHDRSAGDLNADGAKGGPDQLSKQQFFIGINDPLGLNPTGAPFSSQIFDIYNNWAHINDRDYDEHTAAQRAVARGESLFNTLQIPITGVAGLNDVLHQQTINGFCGTCHDSPNVGDHSVPAPLNIGLADLSHRTPDLPLLTVMCNATGQIVQVTDIGRAMVTGKCVDIGKFKGPILRGLAGRAPYFHNGSAATLMDAVSFYDTRFNLHLSQQDKDALVAFLKTL